MLSEDLQNFKDNMKQPWGVLYYKLVWAQLADMVDIKNLSIIDYGSGFGTTANYLAKNNNLLAIEPNADMVKEREQENKYTQIKGKIEKLESIPDNCIGVIICHNVLEFAEERAEIVREFSRILKSGGILSIVKHNKPGKIMFKAIFENNTDEAMSLLNGEEASNTFGRINYYDPEDLVKWGDDLKIEKILGTRMLGMLQPNNDIKYAADWIDRMFEIEMKVCDLEPYKSIAFLNHVLLRKL